MDLVLLCTKIYKIPMGSPSTGAPNAGGVDKLRLSTGRKVTDSEALPPKICVHPPRYRVHDSPLAEEYAVRSTTLVMVEDR